ncbi:1-deoxy-D-xylulose-5-phosphate reductoisomerase [Cryptosporangium aurantiacum]|uniref:1-deoxy-D-xylulose 5-phosphate reductoisomerase n=1 Tax=Cryptosporangium aurantiacum TaxID=134849 RepID=A0A1M7I1Z7_9ACTN|nr:1-deoxy-D-xylulose-5-phosphate reductoisomerase [Cryptosporangium aurantiacum]SHM34659.1 1-deoxy-D-xylulose 5-phosphate reductoisomerase [Cryptosporangium aurantiacum]
MSSREVVILGSTGSVGTQALDVIRRNSDRFRVVGLAGGGAQVELLAAQALEFGVDAVAVARASTAQDLQLAFYAEAQRRGWSEGRFSLPKILAGPDAATDLAAWPLGENGLVLNAITGSIGLAPTLAALTAGRTLALANKESLVAGGPLVRAIAKPGQIVPVDSEHSALAQCLRGGAAAEVRKLILTASGGPFRGRKRADLANVTPEDALAHPTWSMGPVVTINSATMVNKALEVIEAHELFGLPYDRLDVVVHPQSLVHSMVEFYDGSTLAQVSPPDMRLPIALGLAWPDRVPDAAAAVDWTKAATWTFEPLDDDVFPAVRLAREAGEAGGCLPAIYNAANEECVAAFLAGSLPFTGIVDTVRSVVESAETADSRLLDEPGSVEDVLSAERWARSEANRRAFGLGAGSSAEVSSAVEGSR